MKNSYDTIGNRTRDPILVYEYYKTRGSEEWYGELREDEKKWRNSMVDFVRKYPQSPDMPEKMLI